MAIQLLIERISSILAQLRLSPNPEVELMAEIVLLANTNFENLESFRHIPKAVQKELSEQQLEIRSLHQRIVLLENQLGEIRSGSSTIPQQNVDANAALQKELSDESSASRASQALGPVEKITIDEELVKKSALDPEERAKLDRLTELMPQLKQRLKDARRLSTYSVLIMARAVRFVGGNLIYVFEGENRTMLPMMMVTDPNRTIDPILSELFGETVLTHYITDQQFSSMDKDQWEALTKDIQSAFPNVPLKIE